MVPGCDPHLLSATTNRVGRGDRVFAEVPGMFRGIEPSAVFPVAIRVSGRTDPLLDHFHIRGRDHYTNGVRRGLGSGAGIHGFSAAVLVGSIHDTPQVRPPDPAGCEDPDRLESVRFGHSGGRYA